MTPVPQALSRREMLGLLAGAAALTATGCTSVARGSTRRPAASSARLSAAVAPIDGPHPTPRPGGPGPWTDRNLGMNLAWLNDHHGGQRANWLSSGFDPALVAGDLEVLAALGIRRVRAFCPIESVMAYDGSTFALDAERAGNLHSFLDMADRLGISIIPVLADGHVDSPSQSLDGKFRWELVMEPSGIDVYRRAVAAYVTEFRRHDNVFFWELHNEPYGNLTWSPVPQKLGVTRVMTHGYLVAAYHAAKELSGSTPVGFSDLEEEQQNKYRLFSVPSRRAALIDDCTDVYALHIYRAFVSQLGDFSHLKGKPKWCVELGDYNYYDPTGDDHNDLPAFNQLDKERPNFVAFTSLAGALQRMGFTLFMPWSMADNIGMFVHEADGKHVVKELPRWMAGEILASS